MRVRIGVSVAQSQVAGPFVSFCIVSLIVKKL